MNNNIDRYMSRLNDRLMSSAQRDDIRACIDEIKNGNKAKASEAWVIANRWSEHFDGISGDDDATDEPKDEPPASEADE